VNLVGRLVELDVGPPAHGGSCVARHDGEVFFVRHALPGERVRARVTEQAKRFARADAVEVLRASPHRVEPACPVARPGGCGGCDWQHARLDYQRRLKEAVVSEQLRRLAGIERDIEVEPVVGGGLGWRTRVRFAVDADGRAGFRKARSHEVIPVTHCPIAHPLVEAAGVEGKEWNRASEVEVAASASSGNWLVRTTSRRDDQVRTHHGDHLVELVRGREFRVSAGGFWQVHPGAPAVLTGAVLDGLGVRSGEHALDLYSGAGLFAAVLAEAVGPGGSVVAVESSSIAAADATHNLRDLAWVRVHRAEVARALAGLRGPLDVVVLDPPRAGAGARVVRELCRLTPRAIAYVACDPASLARDLATFAAHGYQLDALRAFDLFPQTHHVECVAIVRPGSPG
jgi:tRNA/tmRNA/rRNA uracil-C5-methylase (TrmA/RlmC/RlmD family)